MATEDEAREAADGTEVQVEAVDLGTVHLQAHPEGKLSSLTETKSVGEIIDSTEGTLNIPEDQVLIEAPSDVQLPPEHNPNGEASSLHGHTDKEEKVSNEQPHDSDQEVELDPSNGINKEDVTDGVSHGESTTEDSCLLKHKKDEEPMGDDQQDLAAKVDDDSVQEDTLKTENAIDQTDDGQKDQNQEPEKANENTEVASITNNADVDNAIKQTDDGQQDQIQEPEKANENTEPASIANNADVEIVAEAATGLQFPLEKRVNNSDDIPETIDENIEADEPAKADGVVHPEDVAKVEDQQSQQPDTMDADVAPEEIKCEETDQQEEKPKSEAHEPTIDAQGVLNQESAEETDVPINEKIEETAHQRDVAAPKETTLEHEATSAPPVNTQVQNQESLEEIEDTEVEIQPSSGFRDAIPEDQSNLDVTIDNDTVNEDTVRAIEQQDDGQQDEDIELEKETEHTQSASMTNIPHAEIETEATSGVQTPGEPNLDNSDAVPDTIDANAETDEPIKANAVVHPDQKESFPEDTSTAEPTEEVVKAEDQQSQQADAIDVNMVQEEVPKSEHTDDPATDTLELLNQVSAEEIDGPVNTEGTAHKETTPEYDTTTRDPPVDIQAQNQESLEGTEATVEEREVAEAVDTETRVQQSSIAFEEAVPEDKHNLGVINNTAQEDTLEATGKTKDGEQYQDLGPENATEGAQPATIANIPEVEVITEAPSGIQTPVEINLDISESIPDISDGYTETDEPANAHDVVHPDKKESFPEDTSITEPAEEVVRLEDQQSQQADEMDAGMLPKSEDNDEPATDALEVLNQESAEETDGPVNEKTEEIAHQSNMPDSDGTPREAPATIQVQNQESVEEREDTVEETEVAEAVDTEAPVQQSSVAFEEAVPEDQHYLGVTDNTLQEDTLESTGQTKDGHQYQVLGPDNATENTQPASTANIPDNEVITEAPSEIQTPVGINLDISDADPDTTDGNTETDERAKADEVAHPEKKESFSEDTSTAEPTEEVVKVEDQKSQQADTMDADVVQEEVPKSEHTDEPATDALEVLNQESAEETDGPVNEKTEETVHESNMPASEETTPEYDAAIVPPVNIQVQNQEPLDEREATVEERDIAEVVGTEAPVQQSSVDLEEVVPEDQNITESTAEASDVVIVDETIEQNVHTEDITETHKQELEPEETKSTEPVESEEASDQRNVAQFDYSAQEDNIQESEMQQTESATEIKETEPTEVEAVPRESNACVSEEPSEEDHIKESETSCDNQEVNITESSEVIDAHKDIITGGISGQSNTTVAGDSAKESNVPEGEPPADILGPEEVKNTQIDEVNETSLEMNATIFQMPTQAENPSTNELHESTEASNIEATEVHGNPHQSDAAAQSEEQATEEISSGLKPESIQENDTEANESQSTSQEKIISTSEESVPEEVATEDNVTTEPEESQSTSQEKIISASEKSVLEEVATEDNVTTEPEEVVTPDVQEVQELSLTEETRDIEAVEPEDQQEDKVSTLEKPTEDSEPNADDQQVHEHKLPEVENSKAVEADEASKQSNIGTPDNAAEESNELESDSDSYAQPAEQVELSKDNENSQLVKAEETSDQSNSVTLEERTTEDSVASEIDPAVDIKQEQPVEEIKGVDATEAEENFHTSQAEPTYDIQQVDGLEEMEDKKNAEDINNGEQSNISVSEEPTLTDNGATLEDHHVESNEGTMGNGADNVVLAQGIKDEIQKSEELKEDACDLGETVLTSQRSENMIDEDAVQTSGNDTVETSNNIHQVKEESNAGSEHNLDPVHVIQESEKEIADEIEESKEIHEDKAVCHDELQTNSEKEEPPQLSSNEPYSVDATIDDTTPLCEEIIHDNASIKPTEIKEIGENKELDSTSEPSVETSIQNNVEDSSGHHKAEDEQLSMSEKNDVDTEAMQENKDEFAADVNQKEQCQEEINADDVLLLKTEENSFDKIEETSSHEETETSRTAATEAVTINEDITDKVSGADGVPSDGSLKTFTGRDLDVSLVTTTSKEESVNDNMENLNLDLPGHPEHDGNNPEMVLSLEETEREMPSSEKLLQTEPGEIQIPNEQNGKDIQDENQTHKEMNEEDIQNTESGEAKKEVEQELPVSHFLMNLILGKQNSDANEDSEFEAARKQGEATEDGSCTFISKQEESMGSLPTENKVDDDLTFVEQEKHEVKCSEETQEMVKEQSDDLKLDTERSTETDEDIKKNTYDLEIPAYQDNPQDEISGELLTGEAAGVPTRMETRDTDISSVELDDRAVGTVCQENMEASTKNENGSLRSSLNDSTNTKAPEEDTLGEGQLLEPLPEDKNVDTVSEQAPSLTESGITDANDLSSDTASVQNPVSAKQDKPTESANIAAACSTDIQLENEEVDKKEEAQHAKTATDEVFEENVEAHVNLQKITSSEVTSNELATQITESVGDTQTILAHENVSEENFLTAAEIQADGPNMQINQTKKDEAAENETAMEPEKLWESNFQEHQETGTEQKSPEETDEGDQQLLAKKEVPTQEQNVHETVESPQQTVNIKSNEGQELIDSKVQERDLNVVSPREASEAEENFVDVTKPEFCTDEEQSPRDDAEEKIYDEKIKDIEGIKNFNDEAAIKTEAPGAAQKARKKPSLLSGVGSKVKHQLAKVKKAIVGKPGRTKPESPKA